MSGRGTNPQTAVIARHQEPGDVNSGHGSAYSSMKYGEHVRLFQGLPGSRALSGSIHTLNTWEASEILFVCIIIVWSPAHSNMLFQTDNSTRVSSV